MRTVIRCSTVAAFLAIAISFRYGSRRRPNRPNLLATGLGAMTASMMGRGDDIGEGKSVMTTLQRLQDLLVKRFDLERKDLDPAASLEQLGLDSMGTIDLMFQVEDEFGVTFPRDANALKTVQDVVDCIDCLLADPAAVDSDRGSVP